MAKWTVWARDWLAKCEGAGGKLKGEITWWRIGDWQIVGERRGWQIKGVAKSGGALYYTKMAYKYINTLHCVPYIMRLEVNHCPIS